MKRAAIVITVFAGLLLMVGTALAAPRMEIPLSEFNFGYAPQNSKVSYVFWLHSVGDDTLRIEKVVPG